MSKLLAAVDPEGDVVCAACLADDERDALDTSEAWTPLYSTDDWLHEVHGFCKRCNTDDWRP